MKRIEICLWILCFGAAWGLNELFAGGAFSQAHSTLVSIWLPAWAFFVLAMARGFLNKPGTSIAIALVAVLFKALHTEPYFCHLLGIALLGVAFDLSATLLLREKNKVTLKTSLAGVMGIYLGQASFALTAAWILRSEYWLAPGFDKVNNHIFIIGSLAALAAAVLVPAGFYIGLKGKDLLSHKPRWALSSAFAVSIMLWLFGAIHF